MWAKLAPAKFRYAIYYTKRKRFQNLRPLDRLYSPSENPLFETKSTF